MSEPTGLEKIRTWIEEIRAEVAIAQTPWDYGPLGEHVLPRVLAALKEAVTVIDGECLPGEIDVAFETLLDILNGTREETKR